PLVTLVGLVPIPGHPGLVGRDGPPKPAHPDEIRALVVPGPIAGNPGNVVALRLLIRGDFFNGLGWCLRGDGTRLRVEDGRLTEGLVDRPAGQLLSRVAGAGRHWSRRLRLGVGNGD